MLQELYEQYKESLSKSDHRIFSFLLEHEQELHIITSEDIANTLGISPATISRFWAKIGVKNLKELKWAFYQKQNATPLSRINGALSQWGQQGITSELLTDRLSVYMERTFRVVTPDIVDRAVEMINQAQHLYMFAPDAAAGIGQILKYRLQRLGILVTLLPTGSQIYDMMINIQEGDLLLLFGYSRLLTEVQILLSYGRQTGCCSILFTDIMAHEALSMADLILYSYRGEPNDYHSMAAPVILADMLIMKIIQSMGGGLEKARKLEHVRKEYAHLLQR